MLFFHFIDYGVLIVICLAYQECFGAWRLDHLLWFSVLTYRSMQLSQCDRLPPPPDPPGLRSLYLREDQRGHGGPASTSRPRVLLSR